MGVRVLWWWGEVRRGVNFVVRRSICLILAFFMARILIKNVSKGNNFDYFAQKIV